METQTSSDNFCEDFTCSLCGYETTKLRKIYKHFRKQHSITDLLQCPFCKYVVTEETLFFQHKQAVHPKDRFSCNVCKFSTRKWTRWKRHVMGGHSQSMGKEDAVTKKKSNVLKQWNPVDGEIADSLDVSTMSKQGKLNDFSHVFDRPLSFQHSNGSEDLLLVGNREQKQCNFSDKTDAKDKDESIILQTKGHTTLKQSTCNKINSVCNSKVSTPCSCCIDKEKQSYTPEPLLEDNKEVTDSQCTKDLQASSNETRNEDSCNSEKNADVLLQLASEHCNKMSKNKRSVTQHMSAHENKMSFVCEICNKVYKTVTLLKRHSGLHTSEEAYGCKFCDKRFKYKSTLTQHMISHTGEKPHQCSYCSFATGWKRSLTLHERAHRNERLYKCNACEFTSVQPNTLKKHCRIHTGEKPYQCDVCLRYFSRKDHVMNHKRKIHRCL